MEKIDHFDVDRSSAYAVNLFPTDVHSGGRTLIDRERPLTRRSVMAQLTRRRFLQSSAAAAAPALLLTGTRASGNIQGANDRLRIAIAGLNSRGKAHISGWLEQENVEIAYVADPDQRVLARTVDAIEKKT